MLREKIRKCCLILLVGFGLVSELLAAPTVKASKIEVPNAVFDFGTVSEGEKIAHTFKIKNSGAAALTIDRVVPDCGCTVSTASTKVIEPEDSGEISVEFDTTGFSGQKVKTVRIYTNDPEQETVMLSLRGEISPDISVDPPRVMFGRVVKDQIKDLSQTIRVSVREDSKTRITGVKSYSPQIEVKQQDTDDPMSRTFVVSLRPDISPGELRERVVIGITGSERTSINVPIFASIEGPIRLTPAVVSFGVIEGENLYERTIKIENLSPQNVTIRSIEPSDPAVSATLHTVTEGKEYLLDVEVDPKQMTKDLRGSVKITTSSSEQEVISLNVYGIRPPR